MLKIICALVMILFNVQFNTEHIIKIDSINNQVESISNAPEHEFIKVLNKGEYEGNSYSINESATISLDLLILEEEYAGVYVAKSNDSFNFSNSLNTQYGKNVDNISTIELLLQKNTFGSAKLSLEIYCYKYVDNVHMTVFSETMYELNIYSFMDYNKFHISFVSVSTAAEYSYDYITSQNSSINISKDDYIYNYDASSFSISRSAIDEGNKIAGYFNIQTEYLTFLPARGIEVGCLVSYFDEEIYFKDYTDENGYYEIDFELEQGYEIVELFIMCRTEYVNVKRNLSYIEDGVSHYISSTYKYQFDITDNIYSTNSNHYLVSTIITSYEGDDRGQAFCIAQGLNAAGDFCKNIIEKDYQESDVINVFFPVENTTHYLNSHAYDKINKEAEIPPSGFHICLATDNKDGYLHEYGHYVTKLLDIRSDKIIGGEHTSNEDLAIRYKYDEDLCENDHIKNHYDYQNIRGYGMAWNEGFATFFSNIVQKTYDYSSLCGRWCNEYNAFRQLNIENAKFALRESNERTVTNILLSLSDPYFKYSNAIGVSSFFEKLRSMKKIYRLSQLLYYLDADSSVPDSLIKNCYNYYKLAPYVDNYNTIIASQNNIEEFEWNSGNYASGEYKEYDDNGEVTLELPVELSNNNFVFIISDSKHNILLEKEIEVSSQLSNTISYIPTAEEWEGIFTNAKSNYCYWYVQGSDWFVDKYQENHEWDSYAYVSEQYEIILDSVSLSPTTCTNNINYSNIDFTLYINSIYLAEEDKFIYRIIFRYDWVNMPQIRYSDSIIITWTRQNEFVGNFNSKDYYTEDECLQDGENVNQLCGNRYYGNMFNELYYYVNKPSVMLQKMYGITSFDIETNGFEELYIVIKYNYYQNSVDAHNGVDSSNYPYTTTSSIVKYTTYFFD